MCHQCHDNDNYHKHLPFSPSSSAAFVSIFADRCPFLLRGLLRFFDVGTFPAKSGRSRWDVYPNQIQVRSKKLKIDEHWIFFFDSHGKPSFKSRILQLYTQIATSNDTNHFAEKKSTTNAAHHACQDGSFWKVTGTYEAHCLPQGAKHEKTFSHWVISDYDQGVNTKLESDLELVYAKKKSVSSLTVSFLVGSRKWGIEMFAWRKCMLVFGHLSFKESMYFSCKRKAKFRFASGSPTAQRSLIYIYLFYHWSKTGLLTWTIWWSAIKANAWKNSRRQHKHPTQRRTVRQLRHPQQFSLDSVHPEKKSSNFVGHITSV